MPHADKLILTEGMLTIEAAQSADDGKLKPRRFDMVAYSGHVMRVAGWGNPLVVDLQGLQIAQNNKPIFLGHSDEDTDCLIGQTDSVKVQGGQLMATGSILGHSDKVRQVLDWHSWARTIHKWGLANLVAAVLESAGPIALVGAQIVYVSQPLLQPIAQPGRLQALADLLEDPQHTRAFLDILGRERS